MIKERFINRKISKINYNHEKNSITILFYINIALSITFAQFTLRKHCHNYSLILIPNHRIE